MFLFFLHNRLSKLAKKKIPKNFQTNKTKFFY